MRVGIWGIASFIFLALAPAALGARYAAPKGEGSECTQEKPCALREAVSGAKAGDEVIVTSGTYEVTPPAISAPPATNVQIHGDQSGPMPKISAGFGGPVFTLTQAGDSLSYLEIENNANGGEAVVCFGSRLERLKARIVGMGATGVFMASDCTVRNSLFRVEGGASHGLLGAEGTSGNTAASARNVTVIASGSNSTGAVSEYNEGAEGSFTLELVNSILQGTEQDLEAITGSKGPGNISVTHSNFDTSKPVGEKAKVIDGGGNQTAPPLFVDAENRDYREAAGSPTIDAGIAGELGPLDLAGNPRTLGAAPDIGAYEALSLPKAPLPVIPELQSLNVSPSGFRAAKSGSAVASAKKKAKPKGPVGTTVTFSLSEGGTVTVKFAVEQLTTGRKAGKRCVKQTAANKGKAKCTLVKKLAGGFSDEGTTGQNHFKFSGRLGSKALKPGRYKLVGSARGVDKSAAFTITG
jgi:hypothetical protein